ncbi:ATP-dependent DNA helicase [Trichonephila clavipes]|nr:ATP-dependent DNA helicase [Trichonephila clavipes]
MIHGPFCNRNRKTPCIVDIKCSKRFPRQMLQETQTGENGYPLYRHRKPGDGGHVAPDRVPESGMLEDFENSWVVPYSPLLCKIFKTRINVEYCNSVKSIKYICKYVTKESDAARLPGICDRQCLGKSIAATLLAGGRTAHLAFKLPLDLARSDSATCNIAKGTGQGHVLKTCKLTVWAEATMSHRNAFHALDKTLQDLRGSSAIMGGATLHVEKFSLTTNMRSHIQGDLSAEQFANKLLQIGDGKVPEDPSTGLIIMPYGQIVNSPDELLSKVYPNIQQNLKDQN